MSGDERFSDKDVRRIIGKATRIEDDANGVTYDQLKDIASSVGVNEHAIQHVLREEAPEGSRLRRAVVVANWVFYGAASLVGSLILPLPSFSSVDGGDLLLVFAGLAAFAAKRRDFGGFYTRLGALWCGYIGLALYGQRNALFDPDILWGKVLTSWGTVFAISSLIGTLILILRGNTDENRASSGEETMRARIGRKLKSWIDIIFHRSGRAVSTYEGHVS